MKQAEENPEKILKKIETLEDKLQETEKDTISINDPDARFMKNKKGKMGIRLQWTNRSR